ncbi:hypothetical protein J1792_15740 [Streptomyces triculaminicus]|uniref:Transmembrane protein n=2 Tax=Streptomyces TaxID=1883 RepID=A0A939FP17_9ACTN|nr:MULTISPECIES: hypothetical protein [Streptomyces]MBO0654171.1 hypothetical protein [Streptomyces triculaminicus]QSY48847.1 hypothetical protein J3S04_28120 [Streptomyces griseocarneus]
MDHRPTYPAPPGMPYAPPPAPVPEPASAPTGRRRRFRVPKPDFDALFANKGLLLGLLLFPFLVVVAFLAQFLELLYYAGWTVYAIVMSPYWSVRALWHAFGPATTPQELTRRAEARATVKAAFGCLGILLILAVVVLGIMIWIGLKQNLTEAAGGRAGTGADGGRLRQTACQADALQCFHAYRDVPGEPGE